LGSVARRPQVSSALFFSYNMALGPPYRVIVDTNFINFSIQNKVRPSRAIPTVQNIYTSPVLILQLLCLVSKRFQVCTQRHLKYFLFEK
jgi:hypothetical protein